MPDTLSTQVVHDGRHLAVLRFTNQSDGTGESAAQKVDASSLSGAPSEVKIKKIKFATQGMAVKILWDAGIDVMAFNCPADMASEICFDPPLVNNAASGKNGDILFTTIGHTAGDSYNIELHLVKKA